jgi:hypothetical protein
MKGSFGVIQTLPFQKVNWWIATVASCPSVLTEPSLYRKLRRKCLMITIANEVIDLDCVLKCRSR